jgi:hypothetical protein
MKSARDEAILKAHRMINNIDEAGSDENWKKFIERERLDRHNKWLSEMEYRLYMLQKRLNPNYETSSNP